MNTVIAKPLVPRLLRTAPCSLAALMMACGGCGQSDGQYVLVSLSSPATAQLQVQATLDGAPYGKKEAFQDVGSQFVLKLPAGLSGRVGVTIEGFQNDSCLAGEGRAEAQLTGQNPVMLDVPFNRLTLHDCRVDVPILNRVWGSGSGDVWVTGNKGTLLHYDGRTWTQPTESKGFDTGYLGGIWGTGPRDIYVAGSQKILHFDGKWERSWAGEVDLTAVGGKQGDIWAVGAVGALLRLKDGKWEPNGPDGKPWIPAEAGKVLLRGTGVTPDGVLWAIGDDGTALRFDPAMVRWIKEDLGTASTLTAIASTSGGAFIVGANATLFRWNAGKWTPQAISIAYADAFLSLAIEDMRTLWLGGFEGIVFRCDPSSTPISCQQLSVPSKTPVEGLWVGSSGEAWIVGGRRGPENGGSGLGSLYRFQP